MKVNYAVEVELGKCVADSNVVHVIAEKGEMFHRSKCNHGAVKFTVTAKPFLLKFPAKEDGGDKRPGHGNIRFRDEGTICPKCIAVMQAEEAAKHTTAPPAEKPKPAPAINALERIATLKAEYIAGKIPWSTYDKQAHFWDHAAREAGLLGRPIAEGIAA